MRTTCLELLHGHTLTKNRTCDLSIANPILNLLRHQVTVLPMSLRAYE